ncbi:MAG: hypothetical protein QHH24_07720 [Candidatus Bathyarchaeota archaeon]|nr:hypothetical protein [Candidatus Bathyarchaeota archaeon]
MKASSQTEEIRWQVIVAMLEEFPTLKKRLEQYLKEEQKQVK